MNENNKNQERLKALIEEIETNRNNSKELLVELKKARESIGAIIPKTIDFKNKYVLEGKLKTLATLIGSELSVIKHIDDSSKTEFELRKKLDNEDIELKDVSITMIAKALEQHSKKGKN
jgi:hypothetical protein